MVIKILLKAKFFIATNFAIHCVKNVQIRSFFWSVFSCIRTEYEDLRSKSPYPVRMQENMDQKKLRIWKLSTQWYLFTSFKFCHNFNPSLLNVRCYYLENTVWKMYSVNFRIQYKYGKIRTRINSVIGHFKCSKKS